jgi:hypothetical protein
VPVGAFRIFDGGYFKILEPLSWQPYHKSKRSMLSPIQTHSIMPYAVLFAFSGTPIDKKNRSTYRCHFSFMDNNTAVAILLQ